MTDPYREVRADDTFVGGAVQEVERLKRQRAWEELTARLSLFGDLCALLHLDPERATAEDVLRLVGECVDRATDAERLREERDRAEQQIADRISFDAALREAIHCCGDDDK